MTREVYSPALTYVGRAALVTGAGQRLGRAMAEALGQRGAAVALHYRGSVEGAKAAAGVVTSAGGRAVLVCADLTDEADTQTLLPRAAEALGQPIDILVNNASTFEGDSALDHSRLSWDLHMQTNLRMPILLSQQLALALPPGHKADIINMIDQRVWKLNPTFFTYTLSKAALWTATQTLAQALAPNIRVNAIGPGPTLRNARQSEDDFRKQAEATLLKVPVGAENIVQALLFLLDAKLVTGQMIAVDGGQHLGWETPDVVGIVE